jgi:hypothetical protein
MVMDEEEKLFQEITGFQDEFQEIASECRKFFFMTRAKELQIEARDRLKTFEPKAEVLKEKAIALESEDAANAMLCYEELISAFVNELSMWIALKDDDTALAWDCLVNTQTAISLAMQAHSIASNMQEYVEHLSLAEQVLFPPQLFFSPGMIIREARCSICDEEYGECNHVVGRPYMGQLCIRDIVEAEIEEASLVEKPANKKARGIYYTDTKGVRRDFLTWRVTSSTETEQKDENAVVFTSEIDFTQKRNASE